MPLFEFVDAGKGLSTVRSSGKVLLKNIENRDWKTNYRGELYIHVGTKDDTNALEGLLLKGFPLYSTMLMFSNKLPKGAIIGSVELVDIVEHSDSPWFTGKYGWVFQNPKPLKQPIPCKGKLGLFEVEIKQ
jgi:hypothetical protein